MSEITDALRITRSVRLDPVDPSSTPGFTGDKVAGQAALAAGADRLAQLQERLLQLGVLDGRVDGVLGEETEHGVRELQRSLGLLADGTCGPVTLRALAQLARTVTSDGDLAALRAGEAVRRAGVAGPRADRGRAARGGAGCPSGGDRAERHRPQPAAAAHRVPRGGAAGARALRA